MAYIYILMTRNWSIISLTSFHIYIYRERERESWKSMQSIIHIFHHQKSHSPWVKKVFVVTPATRNFSISQPIWFSQFLCSSSGWIHNVEWTRGDFKKPVRPKNPLDGLHRGSPGVRGELYCQCIDLSTNEHKWQDLFKKTIHRNSSRAK